MSNDNEEQKFTVIPNLEALPVYVDWFLGVSQSNGTILLDLGAIDPPLIGETPEIARAFTTVRLRMNLAFAASLRDVLGNLLDEAHSEDQRVSASVNDENKADPDQVSLADKASGKD